MQQLTSEQLEELRGFDTPTVCNAVECFGIRSNTEGYMRPGMMLRTADTRPVVGYAATARASAAHTAPDAHEQLMGYYRHIREMGDPTIAVVQDTDPVPVSSFWGEVQAAVHQSLGCTAALMQGGVRDIPEASAMGFHFFSTQINVSHGYIHVERYGCPVDILGLTVHPGDLLHMDQHGVVSIPHEVAGRLAEACRAVIEAEYPMLKPAREAAQAGRKVSMEEIETWRKAMAEARNKAAEPFRLR